MQLTITDDLEELSNVAAEWIAHCIESTLRKKDRFTFVLSGGSTPKKIYQILASGKYVIDWSAVHFFWGDERFVPFTDPRNNARMAFEFLLDHIPATKDQIHIMRTDIDPQVAADEYEQTLHQYFANDDQSFDLVMLGLGDNAHTLSLFPGYGITLEKKKWVKAFYLKEQDMYRITLTASIVNAADRILFLVSGRDKASALQQVLEEKYDPNRFPAQAIHPVNDQVFWMVDKEAAGQLKQ